MNVRRTEKELGSKVNDLEWKITRSSDNRKMAFHAYESARYAIARRESIENSSSVATKIGVRARIRIIASIRGGVWD